jgi:hypothetical protein
MIRLYEISDIGLTEADGSSRHAFYLYLRSACCDWGFRCFTQSFLGNDKVVLEVMFCLLRQYPFFFLLSINLSIYLPARLPAYLIYFSVCMSLFLFVCLSVFQLSTGYWLSHVILSHLLRLQFSDSLASQLPFPTLFRVVLVVIFLSGDQVFIRLGHLLSSMRVTCP